jgi:hypothetical protein
MTKGIVQIQTLQPIDFTCLQQKAVAVEEAILLKRTRKVAAQLLKRARKERGVIRKQSEHLGYAKGYMKGQQEALRCFHRCSPETRAYKKYLEQTCLQDLHAIIVETLGQTPEGLRRITAKILKTIKARIRQLPITKVICHSKQKAILLDFKEQEGSAMFVAASPTADPNLLIFITPHGSIEINILETLQDDVNTAMKMILGKK